MSWSDTRRFARIFVALALAGLTAGVFSRFMPSGPPWLASLALLIG